MFLKNVQVRENRGQLHSKQTTQVQVAGKNETILLNSKSKLRENLLILMSKP